MTQFTIYSSLDAGAPVLNGLAGSLVTVLDACLVDGYGTQVAAGWTINQTDTNKRVYQSGNNTACPSVVLITDTTNTTATAVGGISATSTTFVSITNPFPSTVLASVLSITKSDVATVTARPWYIVADNRTFYLFVDKSATFSSGYSNFYFGEIYSYRAAALLADPTRIIIGNNLIQVYLSMVSVSYSVDYMAKTYSGLGEAIVVKKVGDTSKTNATSNTYGSLYAGAPLANAGFSFLNFPTLGDVAMYTSPMWISEAISGCLRGHLRGIQFPLHILPLSNLDTFTGVGVLAGKTYKAFNANNNSTIVGQIFVETSNTVDTN